MKKILFIILSLFVLVQMPVLASPVQIYTIPLFISGLNVDSAWGFQSTSEIAANEIINVFAQTAEITSPNLQDVQTAHANDMALSQVAAKWVNSQMLDINSFAKIEPSQDKVLIVASGIVDKKGKINDAWDVLKFSLDFDINGKYEIITKAILIDNKENVVLWQKSYSYMLDTNRYSAKNSKSDFAIDEREKYRSFAHNIIARDAVENLSLRLNPKSIDYASKVKKTEQSDSGVGLKYYKNMPITKITPPAETMEERLRNDDSFEL